MRAHEEEFRAKGAVLAAIGMGDRFYARAFREETGISFPLLVDEKREAYQAVELKRGSPLHIFRRINFNVRARAAAAGHRNHKLGQNPLQLGGSFIFGPGNVDRFAHVNDTFGDGVGPEELLAALED